MQDESFLKLPIPTNLPDPLAILTARRFFRWLAVALIVIGSQFTNAPVYAQTAVKHPVPSAKHLPQAMAIIDQTSKIDTASGGAGGSRFSWQAKKGDANYSKHKYYRLSSENDAVIITGDPTLNSHEKRMRTENKITKPEKGTFYDREGRLRHWVLDKSAPGGVKVLELPLVQRLRNFAEGWIDWGFESDYVGTDFGDRPVTSTKSITDQTYRERKNAKMHFITKNGLSFSMPNPMEIGKTYYARGVIHGPAYVPIQEWSWVDGKKSSVAYHSGKEFGIEMKFSTTGIHSLKVKARDADGVEWKRFITFPVGFAMTVTYKIGNRDGGELALKIQIKGEKGPFKFTYITNDGQKFEKIDTAVDPKVTASYIPDGYVYYYIPNPGQDTIKWVDVLVKDIKAGYVASRRIKIEDVPVEASLSASKTTLAPEEKTELSVDIKGGEPLFIMSLYENGKRTQARFAHDRKGKFVVSFDEPGKYSMYVDVQSKNIAGEKTTHTTQTLILTVTEPTPETPVTEDTVSVLAGTVGSFDVSKSGYKWLGLPGWMNGSVAITISGSNASANITYEANDLIYTDYTGVASGVISGYLTREGKLVLAGRIPFQANDLTGCERTNSSGDQRTCQGSVVVWIKGRRVGNRLEGNWQFDRKHDGTWQSATIDEKFLTPDEVEAFDNIAAETVNEFEAGVANSNEYDLFKDALMAYFE